MGARQVTISNLEVIDVKAEVNMIALKGAIPGARGQLVILKKQEV
jgi:large subunit ribosomal protein L3